MRILNIVLNFDIFGQNIAIVITKQKMVISLNQLLVAFRLIQSDSLIIDYKETNDYVASNTKPFIQFYDHPLPKCLTVKKNTCLLTFISL